MCESAAIAAKKMIIHKSIEYTEGEKPTPPDAIAIESVDTAAKTMETINADGLLNSTNKSLRRFLNSSLAKADIPRAQRGFALIIRGDKKAGPGTYSVDRGNKPRKTIGIEIRAGLIEQEHKGIIHERQGQF